VTSFEFDGKSIDAAFDVAVEGDRLAVVLHPRGGSGAHAKNRDYRQGLLLALQRMRSIGGEITDAFVDSGPARRLSIAERRLSMKRYAYPIRLADLPGDLNDLAGELSRAQVAVGQAAGSTGGNSTKRIKLLVRVPDAFRTLALGGTWLRFGSLREDVESEDLASRVSDSGVFDPTDERDARRRVMRAIAEREGQPDFRRTLLRAYRRTCAFSRFDAVDALEAAHIRPYLGVHTNHVRNGLLLRADLHTLFDRRLVSIDADAPGDWRIELAPPLRRTQYRALHRSVMHRPSRQADWPDKDAVRRHRDDCRF
jgi:hypothetical protein